MHDLLDCNFSQSVIMPMITRTNAELLIKSARPYFPSVFTHEHIIGRAVARSTVDRYSLIYERIDLFMTTATFERTIKVVLSPFQAHNIAGGLYSTR